MQNYLGDNLDVITGGLVTGISGLMSGGSANNVVGGQTLSGGLVGGGSNIGVDPKSTDLVFASFNQDTTSLAVGTTSGYKLYSLSSTESLEPIYENGTEGVYIAERLFSSSLVAIVTHSAPRKLKVCHFKKGTEICNYSYTSKILAVKMNRARLVVCLEESLFIHNIRDMKVLHTIRETPPNKHGLCALSTDSDHCYLAYPGHSTVGELQIFDALNLASTSMIPAHSGQLAAIQFSPSGTRIATASDKGTVIRVFSVTDGAKLYELRRGLKRTATIYSLSFSPCGLFLACSSNTETVHIFKLEETTPREASGNMNDTGGSGNSPPGVLGSPSSGDQNIGAGGSASDGSWMGYLSNVVSASATYLPSQVTDTLLQGRAFATVHHNLYGLRNICALALIKKTLRLLLTSDDGYLYIYGLDVHEGGDCHLIRQFLLTSNSTTGLTEADLIRQREQELEVGGVAEGNDKMSVTSGRRLMSTSPGSSDNVDYAQTRYQHSTDRNSGGTSPNLNEESEKFHEMAVATETPPKQCFLLDDDGEFPPMQGGASSPTNAKSPRTKTKFSANASDNTDD